MSISISNIPSSIRLGTTVSPAISFSGALQLNGTVRIRDLTSGYDSGAVAYSGTSGTVPFTPSGSIGVHVVQLVFSGDGTFNYNIPVYNTLLTTAVAVDPVLIYVGQTITSPITPVTTNGGDGSARFAISPALPSGLSFNTTTGQITGNTSISSNVLYTITVTDLSGQTSSKQVTITISFHVPVSSPASVTIPYNSAATQISLSIQYQYTSIAVVSPPTNGNVSIVGTALYYTPTKGRRGSDSFTYTASGYGGTSNISTVSITIDSTNVEIFPIIKSGSLGRGITSIPFNPVKFGATGGFGPYYFILSNGNLPAGMALISDTIVGTPTTNGNFNFSIATIDSSTPTPFSTVTNYSINVLPLGDVVSLVNTQPSSKYSKTSQNWNKTPLNITPRNEWDQWGLFRSYIGSTVLQWGSDSIQNTVGTVDIPYSGTNVDVVVIASGSADPGHPEFAVNPDGTGGSRIKYYDWFKRPGTKYIDKGYHSTDANAAAAVTSIVAGNTYGWARNANIYTLDLTLMTESQDLSLQLITAFNAVYDFHSTKPGNPVTGLQNPTIVICNQTLTQPAFTATNITSVQFKGSVQTGPFSTATLATYYINRPFKDLSKDIPYQKDIRVYLNNTAVTTAVKRCTNLVGLIFVGGAGDYKGYIDSSTGLDYNDTLTVSSPNLNGVINYNQGASPSNAGICVGAADATAIEQIADYSAKGPGVNIYSPGSNLMVAFNGDRGVKNLYEGTPTAIPDFRNERYSIGKVSGTAYAAAQVAGFLACLAQVKPDITQNSALNYLINNAGINQLSSATNSNSYKAGTSVQLYKSSQSFYASFLQTYGVWPNPDLISPINSVPTEVTLFFTSPVSGTYTLVVAADNELRVYLNGSATAAITTVNSYYGAGSASTTVTLNQGINTLKCIAFNYNNGQTGGYSGLANIVNNTYQGSFGIVVQDSYGNHIFETSSNLIVSSVPTISPPINNLYFFGKFPNNEETVISSLPAVATNQPFSISISSGVSNSAFYFNNKNELIGTQILGQGTINNNFTGNFTLTNQVFTTPGIKTYDFYFANTTNRVSLSVEVIAHDANDIISSYTQTGKLWNKTYSYIPPNNDWLNWGLLRSSTTTNTLNWGSDSVKNNTDGSISIPYAGLNVDIVILDSGSIDPNHPEFALYSDGTGGSRVKYYDWTGVGYPTIDGYNTSNANRVTAIAGIAAGNTYGWARAANIYSINYTLLSTNNQTAKAFDLVNQFHISKTINPKTGYKNPTIIIAGWATTVSLSPNGSVVYQGTTYASPTPAQLTQFGLFAPYSNLGDNNFYLNVRNIDLDNAVDFAVNSLGITVVSIPGDTSAYCAKDSSDSNWNNYFVSGGTPYYYHQGASPGAVSGVICVGALDSEVNQHKAPYSGNGPRVDLFAPGSDQITAINSPLGIFNNKLNTYTPTVQDVRNKNYYVGKDSGTAYAAANVAGYIACLLQTNPTLLPADALTTVTQYAVADQLTISLQGYGVNADLNGANNLILHSVFPDYNENIVVSAHNSTVTSVALGQNFDIVITNGSPNSYFTYSGSEIGSGRLDNTGSATIRTFALTNSGKYVYRFYFLSTNHKFTLNTNVVSAPSLTSANIIYADDFDRIQNRVKYLVHDVYGQFPDSASQITSATVTATSWIDLYKDISSAYIHQNNSPPKYLNLSTGTRVTAQEANELTVLVNNLIDNFDKVAPQQLVVAPNVLNIDTSTNNIYDLYSRTYYWTTSTDFPNSARNFFNLGGQIEVSFNNPFLGTQKGYFTLTDYISGLSSFSLPIPGGTAISKMYVQGINGNTATIDTVIAPTPGNTALATGTVKVYVSTDSTGGIAGQIPTIVDAPLAQGQLSVDPVNQYIQLLGNTINTYIFTVKNTSPNDITVTKINIIDDINFDPLKTKINTGFPFIVPAQIDNVPGTTPLSISFQNVSFEKSAGLYNNTIQLISDGVNPILNVPSPIITKFGIDNIPNPIAKAIFGPTTSTFNVVSYAGTYTSYKGTLTNQASGFALINPGINEPVSIGSNTTFNLSTPSQQTMGLLLSNFYLSGNRIPNKNASYRSPFPNPVLVVDVASVPNLNTSTQVILTAIEKNNLSNVATSLVDVEVLIDVQDYNIGSWLSPQNAFNGVVGFSYDMINGQRCLTVGFGMGSGSSPEVWAGAYPNFSLYAMSHLGRKFQTSINQNTSSAIIVSTGLAVWDKTIIRPYENGNIVGSFDNYIHNTIPKSTATSNAFLQTYGVWDGRDSRNTSLSIPTATFLARDAGIYTYNISVGSIVSTSTNVRNAFTITNGVMSGDPYIYATSTATVIIDNGTPIVFTVPKDSDNVISSGDIALTPGLHTIKVDATQAGKFGSVGVTIMNEAGYVVWSTLDVMIPNWAEIGRIYLQDDGKPHTYQMVPNTWSRNLATGTSYSSFFANDSLVTVKDNGLGQLSISQNALVDLSGWIITDGTLLNYPYLFYYFSNAENQIPNNSRYNNIQKGGQYTRYFTGFDPTGKVTYKTVLSPGYIAPPPAIIQRHYQVAGGGGDAQIPFWQKLLLGYLLYTLANYVLGLFGSYTVAGLFQAAIGYVENLLVEAGLDFWTTPAVLDTALGTAESCLAIDYELGTAVLPAVTEEVLLVSEAETAAELFLLEAETTVLTDTAIVAVGGDIAAIVTVGEAADVVATGVVVAEGVAEGATLLEGAAIIAEATCGMCFSSNTKIEMSDGTTKFINEINIGDTVFNHNRTKINTVNFIVTTHYTGQLHSPDISVEPFGSLHHPLIIDEKLVSYIPQYINSNASWLGECAPLTSASNTDAKCIMVYNLLVDGDGTYNVNGFGTTSVFGDGGTLIQCVNQGLITKQKAISILHYFHDTGGTTLKIWYSLNKITSKLNFKFINQLYLKIIKRLTGEL